MSLFADDMTIYIDNPKDAARKLLELINEFPKVEWYKINVQKSLAFLYTNDEKSEREIKETLPFTIARKRIKYLGINLPKGTKDLYAENYKTLLKEIKDDTNRWRDVPCSWTERINIVKMTILPKAIYKFNIIPIKLPMAFFTELGKKIFTIYMETQKTPSSQSNLEKVKQSWRNQALGHQTILQSYSNQDSMVLAQNRSIDQWNRIENPEINPHTYGHLIFDKGNKNIQWRKDSLFNKWCWENWAATCKRMKLEHSLTPYTKINSKLIKDFNVRPDSIKLL